MAVVEPALQEPSRRRVGWSLRRTGPWLVAALLLAAYAALLAHHFAPAISTPDANGYWAQGSLLATRGQTWFVPESNVQYVGVHWLVTPDGRYFSRYPPGLAVPIALVYRFCGPAASVLINPVLAVLALLGMFLLTRRLLGPWWGCLGLALLATNPYFTQHALQNDSHMAVAALLVWGMWLLARWERDQHWRDLLLAGVVLGAIPTVRYPEALYALGVGALLAVVLWRRPQAWPHVLVGGLGALVPMVPLLVRNQLCFGAFWRTAYSLTNEQTGFAAEYFQAHAVDYVQALHGDGVGLFFGLGLAGMALLWGRREWRPWAAFLSFTVVPTTLLYMAYYWVPGGPNRDSAAMRFVLPTFACYYLAGLWLLDTIGTSLSRRALLPAAILLAACQVIWGGLDSFASLPRQCYSRQALATLTRELEARLPADAVVLSANAILQHLDFVRRWKCADLNAGRPRPPAAGELESGESNLPTPAQAEKRRIEAGKYAGQRIFGRERAMAYDLREWAAGAPVFFVGSPDEAQRLSPAYFGGRNLRTVTRVAMPAVPADNRPDAGWRGGPPGRPGPAAAVGGRTVDGRFSRLQAQGGLLGLPPEIRELLIAEWVWEAPGPR